MWKVQQLVAGKYRNVDNHKSHLMPPPVRLFHYRADAEEEAKRLFANGNYRQTIRVTTTTQEEIDYAHT